MFDPVRTINQSTDFKITAMNLNFFKKLILKYFCSKSFGTKSCFIQLSVFLNDRVFTPPHLSFHVPNLFVCRNRYLCYETWLLCYSFSTKVFCTVNNTILFIFNSILHLKICIHSTYSLPQYYKKGPNKKQFDLNLKSVTG